MPYLEHPTYDIAVDYYNRGYDVHYYDVCNHSGTSNFSGPALFEVINAVSNRQVEEVAIYGWSHGGGATALLANRLELGKGQGIVPNTFDISATAYIDAVEYDGLQTLNAQSETRRPLQNLGIIKPLANWYHTTSGLPPTQVPFHGDSVPGSDINVDMTEDAEMRSGMDHVDIAEIVFEQQFVINFFELKMPSR